MARRDGTKPWEGYTPYELRTVGAFVRLSASERGPGAPDWKARAHELLAWFLHDQRPPGWNGWPEVVHRAYRERRFLGDLPHGWVGSDFIRSFLDLFAFVREASNEGEEALVLGAGIPEEWLRRREGVGIRNLATPWGDLGYTLQRSGSVYRFTFRAKLEELPAGGIVLVPPAVRPAHRAEVDGQPVPLADDGTLVLQRVPGVVDFFAGEESASGS